MIKAQTAAAGNYATPDVATVKQGHAAGVAKASVGELRLLNGITFAEDGEWATQNAVPGSRGEVIHQELVGRVACGEAEVLGHHLQLAADAGGVLGCGCVDGVCGEGAEVGGTTVGVAGVIDGAALQKDGTWDNAEPDPLACDKGRLDGNFYGSQPVDAGFSAARSQKGTAADPTTVAGVELRKIQFGLLALGEGRAAGSAQAGVRSVVAVAQRDDVARDQFRIGGGLLAVAVVGRQVGIGLCAQPCRHTRVEDGCARHTEGVNPLRPLHWPGAPPRRLKHMRGMRTEAEDTAGYCWNRSRR